MLPEGSATGGWYRTAKPPRIIDKPPDFDRMPLWNWLFELHNGGIFRDLIGGGHALIIPLGALAFLLITITGVIDWFLGRCHKQSRRKDE
jgi:hypothetical protein